METNYINFPKSWVTRYKKWVTGKWFSGTSFRVLPNTKSWVTGAVTQLFTPVTQVFEFPENHFPIHWFWTLQLAFSYPATRVSLPCNSHFLPCNSLFEKSWEKISWAKIQGDSKLVFVPSNSLFVPSNSLFWEIQFWKIGGNHASPNIYEAVTMPSPLTARLSYLIILSRRDFFS